MKPDNILVRLEHPLTAKLADFGLARRFPQGQPHARTGAPLYWAPEIQAKGSYSSKADMFSFGLVLLQCFSHWDPARDKITLQQIGAKAHGHWMSSDIVPLVLKVPSRFQPLIRGLLRRKPEDRWSALQCLGWLTSLAADSMQRSKTHTPVHFTQQDVQFPGAGLDKRETARKKRPASSSLEHRVFESTSLPFRGPTNNKTVSSPSDLPSTLPWGVPHVRSETAGASFAEPMPLSEPSTPGHEDENFSESGDDPLPTHISQDDFKQDWPGEGDNCGS